MDRPRLTRKVALFGALGLVGVVALVVAALFLLVDRGAFKARLEATASETLGMQVGVEGGAAISFAPGLVVTLANVRVRNAGAEVLSAARATIAVDVLSLFGNQLRIGKIVLESPMIAIARQQDGRFSFEPAQTAGESLPAEEWPEISLTGATITYADERFGSSFEARDCRAEARRVRHAGGLRVNLVKGLSFTAELRCGEIRKGTLTLADVSTKAAANDGVFALEPLTARVFGAPGTGRLRADFSGAVPAYTMDCSVHQFPVEAFFRAASLKQIGVGRLDASFQLSTRGKTVKELRQALQGSLSLRGKGIMFSGGDLDRELDRFESSQTFDLVDVGAIFLAGPLGLLVTKGYDFARLSAGAEGRSEIRVLVSDWKVERGHAQAVDVAMATARNRLALHGGLDLVNDRFDDVTIAVVDAQGCATVRQRIHGTFQSPAVERPNALESLAGPALRLLRRGSDLLRGQGCDVFYAGSVAAPK